jgi:hypothetical protein
MIAIPVLVQYDPTPLPCERVERPTVAMRLTRDASQPSGWRRCRLDQDEVDATPPLRVVRSWDAWDPTGDLDEVVVLDGVSK